MSLLNFPLSAFQKMHPVLWESEKNCHRQVRLTSEMKICSATDTILYEVLNILIMLESKSKFPSIISAVRSMAQWNAVHLFAGPSLFIYLLGELNLKIIPHIFSLLFLM